MRVKSLNFYAGVSVGFQLEAEYQEPLVSNTQCELVGKKRIKLASSLDIVQVTINQLDFTDCIFNNGAMLVQHQNH